MAPRAMPRLALVLAAAMLLLLLLAPPRAADATLHPVDYLALQSIRRALNDLPGSRFFSTWDFTSDPCAAFSGVSCSPTGRVVSLALGDPRAGAPGLTGPLPSTALSQLTALTSLSLVPGRVTGRLTLPLTTLPSLRFLALSNNLLAGALPAAFSPSLRTIDLSHNSLAGALPPALLRLPALRVLVLAHNALAGAIPTSAAVTSPLIHLDLRANRLAGGLPASLPSTLVYLSLADNRLSGHVGPALRRLTRLAFLDLGRNWFSGEVPPDLLALRGIRYLQLRHNAFSGALRVAAGRGVSPGATLDLSHNKLTGRVPPELAGAGAVYLNGNRFGGEVPREVAAAAEQGRMRVLFLQDNFLTGIGVNGVPASAAVCAHLNCVAPPPAVVAACPAKGGRGRRRPPAQCGGHRG
ncbi:hypothetical protein QOZ80_9AG0691030 [Eleusine coracana subsp. coracana]|nr:hypothetical protein QOZ80_9AG0691030 [Eleusine coracana subsp. coracana]